MKTRADSNPIERTEFDAACCTSFIDLLVRRAEHQPDAVAFRFLHNGVDESCALTFGQLDQEVRRLAAGLQQGGLAGERVLLLYPSGPEYVIAVLACLYAGAVAVPLYPPLPNRHFSGLETVSRDAEPRAALTTTRVPEKVRSRLATWAREFGFQILVTDDGCHAEPDSWRRPVIDRTSIAYLQYTSGSTVDPKGVMITHDNLLHNCRLISTVIGASDDHVGVGWLPFFHDMGLIGGIFLPVFLGCSMILMPPEAFIMKPVVWLKAIARYGATLTAAPNFAFDLCVRRTTLSQRAGLDLSRWKFAFNGAERINDRTLRQFALAFEECGFRSEAFLPCYGLAESTLLVTAGLPKGPPSVRRFNRTSFATGKAQPADTGVPLVSCGHARDDMEVVIVDPETCRRCSQGEIGEIWVAGPSVAAGYWNRPQLSAERFSAREAETGAGPYLRTGDLGFQRDGELFVTGRLKDLVIIGGRNIYPDDVETTVEAAHPCIAASGAIAFALDAGPKERLVVVAEVDRRSMRDADLGEIERTVRDAVSKLNNVAVSELVLVKSRSLPKTLSGKKKRTACRKAFLQGRLKQLVLS